MKIPSFPLYDVSEDGVVTHIDSGRTMKPHMSNGRQLITLMGPDRKYHGVTLLSVLAEAFVGPRPNKHYVAVAKDGDKMHATADNVVWRTRHDIGQEAYNRTQRHREATCFNKDSIDMVLNTLEQFDRPAPMTELSYLLQVPYVTVRYSILRLIEAGKVQKLDSGYEVIR